MGKWPSEGEWRRYALGAAAALVLTIVVGLLLLPAESSHHPSAPSRGGIDQPVVIKPWTPP